MADNYTALKSSQKKRIISKETFNSLDLSTIPVGSEYEVVSPIEKGDLSADINNALNKAEKSISEPTNQTTGSDGDVLVKKGGGSEWSGNVAKLDEKNTFKDIQSVIVPAYPYDGTDIEHDGPKVYRDRHSNYYTQYGLLSIYRHDLIEAIIQLPEANGTLALTTDIPDTSNLSSFSVEVW